MPFNNILSIEFNFYNNLNFHKYTICDNDDYTIDLNLPLAYYISNSLNHELIFSCIKANIQRYRVLLLKL